MISISRQNHYEYIESTLCRNDEVEEINEFTVDFWFKRKLMVQALRVEINLFCCL